MEQRTISRDNLKTFLDAITANPTFIFSVDCNRRNDLFLRYPPIDILTNGKMAYVGDASDIATRQYVKGSKEKIVLQPAGQLRTMIVKGKNDNRPMKHWQSKGGQLGYNPADHNLYLVAGMYSDQKQNFGTGKRIGRHGQWRSFCMICLDGVHAIRYEGIEYLVN